MKSGANQYFICIRFAPVRETPFHTLLQVYARLAKLGVSVSHMTATRLIRNFGQNHNRKVLQCSGTQQQGQSGSENMEREDVDDDTSQNISSSCHSGVAPTQSEPETDLPMSKYPPYTFWFDNLDKNITLHDMRVHNPVKSIHYFHLYAAHDRIDHSQVSNAFPECDILSLPVTTFIPSVDDCVALRTNYIVLAARVIVDKLPHFSNLQQCVVQNIPHEHSEASR